MYMYKRNKIQVNIKIELDQNEHNMDKICVHFEETLTMLTSSFYKIISSSSNVIYSAAA